ncbi:hypothetical protein [Candidatus Nitrosoglobus terrae]|nr:hypothetical protein [Candidatus Nitrosoglobus terrae]
MKRMLFSCFVALLLVKTPAMAHGGGPSVDLNKCVITIGDYRVQFTAYQPDTSGSERLCQEFPMIGRTVLVFDIEEKKLRHQPIEITILRESDKKNHAHNHDGGTENHDHDKVLLVKPAQAYPAGTITIDANFNEPGEYNAIIKAGENKELTFELPLQVGGHSEMTQWVIAVVFTIAVFGFIMWHRDRGEKMKGAHA